MPTDPLAAARDLVDRPDARYVREPDHDRRIRRGDDFAGDAWRDRATGDIHYVAVGVDPNLD
jgi:hypothetical protein